MNATGNHLSGNIVRLVFLSLFVFFFANAQQLQFAGERIGITVGDGYAGVRGEYHFKNISDQPLRRTLYYPFVVNNELPFPDSIDVISASTNSKTPFSHSGNGIRFPVSIPPRQTAIYIVFYSQKTPANKMEYILTTTQQWQKPLRWAEYIVKMPLTLQLKYLSLTEPKIEIKEGYKVYRIHKTNFMPKTNFRLEWARRVK